VQILGAVGFLKRNPPVETTKPVFHPPKPKLGPTPPRDTPRQIKSVELVHNPELDGIILNLSKEPAWADYCSGKTAALGYLVGLVKEQVKIGPAEIKARIERMVS
jgi:hypothetical protein